MHKRKSLCWQEDSFTLAEHGRVFYRPDLHACAQKWSSLLSLINAIWCVGIHWQNVSGYTCNHGSLRIGNETLRPLEVTYGNAFSVTGVWSMKWKRTMHLTLAGDVSKWASAGIKGRLWNTSSSFFQRGRRQECPKYGQETQHLVPYSQGIMVTCVTWDVPFRRELYAYGNAIPTPPCWGKECPNSCIPKSQTRGTPSLPSRSRVKKPLYRQAQSSPS